MSVKSTLPAAVSELPIARERDAFLWKLLRHLAGTLQKVVGLKEGSGFVSVVGQELGDEFNRTYQSAQAVENLGYAKVVIEQAIALGDSGCRIVVYLKATPEAEAAQGREYFKG